METAPEAEEKKQLNLRKEIRERTVGYIVAALGLVAGLAWNDAIKSSIEYFFPFHNGALWAKFIYAVIITLVVIFGSIGIMKWLGGEEEKK